MSKLHPYLPIHLQSWLKTCCFPLCRFEFWTQQVFRDSSKEELFWQEVVTLIITDSFTEERFSLGYRYRMFMFTFERDRRFEVSVSFSCKQSLESPKRTSLSLYKGCSRSPLFSVYHIRQSFLGNQARFLGNQTRLMRMFTAMHQTYIQRVFSDFVFWSKLVVKFVARK